MRPPATGDNDSPQPTGRPQGGQGNQGHGGGQSHSGSGGQGEWQDRNSWKRNKRKRGRYGGSWQPGPGGGGSQQAPKRDRLPAVRLPVHETVGPVLDDAGDPDADAEDRGRAGPAGGEHDLKPGQDRLDDQADVVLPGIERIVGLGALGQRQVEQIDADPRLTDVDPDDVPVIRVDLQEHARPSAVRIHRAGLGHDPVVDQVAHDVADRRGA